jgi:hypothetical protein
MALRGSTWNFFTSLHNNHRVQFSGSSKSSVMLYTLFMDSVNTLGYKLGSADDTGIPDYYASQVSDVVCDASF